jgi:Transcriptional regulators
MTNAIDYSRAFLDSSVKHLYTIHVRLEDPKTISNLLLRTALCFERMHKEIRRFGTDTELHGAEIGMISAIEENDGIHVIGLADKLGITRSAASQTLARLCRKGMIEKRADPANQSRLILGLSAKGKTVYRNHRKRHAEIEQYIAQYLEHAPAKDAQAIIKFLESLYADLSEYEARRK